VSGAGSVRAVKLRRAMRDGVLVSIDAVPMGVACKCVCPKCGEGLVAKNRDFSGRKTQKHFAHEGSSKCESTGGETAPETALHLTAKDIVERGLRVTIPGLALFPEATQPEFRQVFAAKRVKFKTVAKEPWRPAIQSEQNMRPDIIGTTDKGREIHIEFKVAHAVPQAKIDAAITEKRWMLEIDLARFRGADFEIDALKEFIEQSSADRAWISTDNGFELKDRLLNASDLPTECPLELPKAITSGTCQSCPCRLGSPDDMRPSALRCTGKSRVTSIATLEAWERGEALKISFFAQSILSALAKKERLREQRKTRIAQMAGELSGAESEKATLQAKRQRLGRLLEVVMNGERRIKVERRRLKETVQAIEAGARARLSAAGEALRLMRPKFAPAERQLKKLQEEERQRERLRKFNQTVARDYLNGSKPLCPHCRQPVMARVKNGTIEEIAPCDCLTPENQRTPTPAVWMSTRRVHFVNKRFREL